MPSTSYTSIELRAYLRQRRTGRANVIVPVFEDFLKDVSLFFALRWGAEEYWRGSPRASDFQFKEHKYQALSIRLAVPLEWSEVKRILLPDEDKPRSTLITHIATHCIEEVRIISSGLRRVLSRERVSTPVGKVQQLDTYCMRWLMRQPGRDFAEKGGVRQRVMAVVRREQYDTLENRVFKDFLIRAENLADGYLEEIESDFSDTKIYKAVKQFRTVCKAALSMPEMDAISGLVAFPTPNYVLQQDNRYSKIWGAYSKIISLANLAEKLWERRQFLREKLEALGKECKWQCENRERVKYHSQVWIRPLDGSAEITEATCSHHAEAGEMLLRLREIAKRVLPVKDGVGVVDLTGSHVWGPALCVGGFHENACPRIANVAYPLLDDEPQAYTIVRLPESAASRIVPIESIFPVINDGVNQDEGNELLRSAVGYAADYCARLHGEFRNLDRSLYELVVLSPDDWNAVTQEFVIRSFSMMERRHVRLLWRSIATVLGYESYILQRLSENQTVVVLDFRNDRKLLVTALKYLRDDASGRLIPQRSVYLRNGCINQERYLLLDRLDVERAMQSSLVGDAKVICVVGDVPQTFRNFISRECGYKVSRKDDEIEIGNAYYRGYNWSIFFDGEYGWSQKVGALLFAKEQTNRTLYFDELEPMWVVGQRNEKVVRHEIVKADERFKGGETEEFSLKRGLLSIGEGQHGVEFLFHIGELAESTPLHSYTQEFPEIVVKKDVPLDGKILVSPGQGISITKVIAPRIFKEPIVLDYLRNMTLSKWTIRRLEEEMPRSFPPTCAIVEAYSRSDYGYGGFLYAPVSSLERVKSSVEQYLSGKGRLDDIPDEAFAQAKRKTDNDLRPGESRLHLLDRRNVFGNAEPHLRPYWLTEQSECILLRKLVNAMSSNRNYDKCLRLLAWTYRGGNADVAKCVRKVVRSYVERRDSSTGLTAVAVSFLANNLTESCMMDLERKTLETLFTRLFHGFANGNDFRLFYNLMQFDIDVFNKISFTRDYSCKIVNCLVRAMRESRLAEKPTNYKSCLRAFLYFLRIRETERAFIRPIEWFKRHKAGMDDNIAARMDALYRLASFELENQFVGETDDMRMLRFAARKYLNGQGTIEDIVNVEG